MLRIRVDFNERELLTPGVETTVIFAEDLDFPATELKVGLRVILFCSDFETEAILKHGQSYEWVADHVPGTSIGL